ncbi:MAG: 4-hydroxybenzoate octaprenyltransferase [Nitrospira sp.]|nr:4-hydroxybenzoate octaprenyltransferase [Nitrospira sp.]
MTVHESAPDRPSPSWSWSAVADLIRLRNQSGTWLLMLPSLWALFLANHGFPPPFLLIVFALGSFTMRSLGVVFNDLADRRFDRQVARTRTRPLAAGRLTPRQALFVAAGLTLIAAGLVMLLPVLTILLSPIALFLAATYPFSKRWIHTPQAVLGIAFGWGAIMAWSASRETIEAPAWWLFAATICWAVAYDTIYALQDIEDDRRIGVKSSAIFFGQAVPLAVGLCFVGMVSCLIMAGATAGLGAGYYVTLSVVTAFFVWQVLELRGAPIPQRAFALFQQHVYAGAIILLGIWIGA